MSYGFIILIDCNCFLSSFDENFNRTLYHPHALLLAEEAHIISGLLVGLNVIDCNLCLRDRDLDSLPQVRMIFVIFVIIPVWCVFIFRLKLFFF